jgi:hypothetical protein
MRKNDVMGAGPRVDVARWMDGYLITQLLYVAVKLGIGDALAREPQTATSLAQSLGVETDALRRVLRGLAAEGILDECPGGLFELTTAGACLCRGAVNSLHGAIIARGDRGTRLPQSSRRSTSAAIVISLMSVAQLSPGLRAGRSLPPFSLRPFSSWPFPLSNFSLSFLSCSLSAPQPWQSVVSIRRETAAVLS